MNNYDKSKIKVVNGHFKIEPLRGKNYDITWNKALSLVNSLDIPFFIDAGTLLGMHRDGKFIDHDTDIDISFTSTNNSLALDRLFINNGFTFARSCTYDGRASQLAYVDPLTNIIVDFAFFTKDGDNYIRPNEHGVSVVPAALLDNLHQVLASPTYYTPYPVEDYLSLVYGKWKIKKSGKESWSEEQRNLLKK